MEDVKRHDVALREEAFSHRLLEVSHVAIRLSVSSSYVRRLVRAGKLPHVRVGERQIRIEREALEAFIASRRSHLTSLDQSDGTTPTPN